MRLRAAASSSVHSRPKTRTVPEAAGTMPKMARASVVLPDPDSPTRPSVRPASQRSDTSRTTGGASRPEPG